MQNENPYATTDLPNDESEPKTNSPLGEVTSRTIRSHGSCLLAMGCAIRALLILTAALVAVVPATIPMVM